MSVKVVTDSVSDISPAMANGLGITVVPLNVVFGSKIYRDGIDLTTADTLVERLADKFSRERIYRSKFSPVIGTNVGPSVIGVAVLGDR